MNADQIRERPTHAAERAGLFVALAIVLVGFGVMMVHSSSVTSWPTEFEQVYLSRHVLFVAVGAILAGICACLPARFWFYAAPYFFVVGLSMLALVLVPGLGARVNGSQRWLRLGPATFQPSEAAKIALVLMVARQMWLRRDRLDRPVSGIVPVLLPVLLVAPLVLVQPDLGTTLFLALGAAVCLYAGGWPLRNFVLVALTVVPACGFLVAMRPYQIRRVTGFLAAWTDFDSAPYQLKQSLVSLGEGGVLGVGLGKGWQKLSFLPEANTDFVFAVAGEELGLLGTLGLVAVWCGLYLAGLRLTSRLPPRSFARVAAFTLLTQLVVQAAINVAVVTAMVPPKGISHPLVSYGGSNLVVSLASLGIVVSLSRADAQKDRAVVGP